jgi:hypothetical protein
MSDTGERLNDEIIAEELKLIRRLLESFKGIFEEWNARERAIAEADVQRNRPRRWSL